MTGQKTAVQEITMPKSDRLARLQQENVAAQERWEDALLLLLDARAQENKAWQELANTRKALVEYDPVRDRGDDHG